MTRHKSTLQASNCSLVKSLVFMVLEHKRCPLGCIRQIRTWLLVLVSGVLTVQLETYRNRLSQGTLHERIVALAQEETSWLQLDRSESSSLLQQADHSSDQLQQAGYSSGTGCGSGEGNTAADSATAARKRKGGRPRVYDLDQPIPSGTAVMCHQMHHHTGRV